MMPVSYKLAPDSLFFNFYFHSVNLNRYPVLQDLHKVVLHVLRPTDEIHCPITNFHVYGPCVSKIHHSGVGERSWKQLPAGENK